MKVLKELAYIFTKEQKVKLFILFLMIVAGTFAELFGISAILPVVQIALNPEEAKQKFIYKWLMQNLGLTTGNELLAVAAVGIILIFILKNVYLIFMYGVQYRFIYNNQQRLAVRLMKAYLYRPYTFHLSQNTAELQRNINIDTTQFYAVILNVFQVLIDILLIAILGIFLIRQNAFMALGSLTFIGAAMAIYYKLFKQKSINWGKESHNANGKMIQWLNQAFGGIKEIKITNRERLFEEAFDKEYTQYAASARKQAVSVMIPKYLLETVAISGIMLVIIIEVLAGMDVAELVESLTAFAVAIFKLIPSANRINGSINGILFQLPSVHTVYAGLKDIEFDEFPMVKETDSFFAFKNKIEIEKISYHYPDVEENVLENVSFTIKKGESIAFVGGSGSGKTTMADIILGILEPQEGKIEVDGCNICSNISAWQKQIGYIPQSIYLIDDTIRNNIAFGVAEEEIDEDVLFRVIEQAQLTDFVKSLEYGVNTVVGEQGVRISGGQRQRIGIARALYHNPEILVLDEATSALDQDTEKAVMESIIALQGSKTLIIIAHRLSTIKNCDTVYEVKNKKVVKE